MSVYSPRIGCAGIIKRADGKILMGKRAKDPNRGLWVLPGGGINFSERFDETLVREIREETGIEIEITNQFKAYEIINPPSEHRIIIYFNGTYHYGRINPGSDLEDANFLSLDEISKLHSRNEISPFVVRVLRDAEILK